MEVEGLVKTYRLRSISVCKLLTWSELQTSGFYYRRSLMPKGIKPSTQGVNQDGELVENVVVVKNIEQILAQEFFCYRYLHMTGESQEKGTISNYKNV